MLLIRAIVTLSTLSLASSRVIDRCSQWYISTGGNNCTYCPPGTYKYLDCDTSGESAICKGCGNDHYQTFCNQALSCEPCSQVCPWQFSVIVEACTMYNDVKCMCEQGKYLLRETSKDGVCLNHSQCNKGYRFVKPGTPWNDTVCESCLEGNTFSDVSSLKHCRPCKLCAEFRRNCSTTQNAECNHKPTSDYPDDKPNNIMIISISISIAAVVFVLVFVMVYCFRSRHQMCRPVDRPPPDGEETNDHPLCTKNVCTPPEAAAVLPPVGNDLNNTSEVGTSEGASNEGFSDDATEQERSTDVTEHDHGQAMDEPVTETEQLFEATAVKDLNQTVGERKRTADSQSATNLDNINIIAEKPDRKMEPKIDTRHQDTTNDSSIHVNQNLIAQETGQATKLLAQCLDADTVLKLTKDSKCKPDLSDSNTPDSISSDESVRLHATETNDSSVSEKCSDLADNLSSIESVRLHAMETDGSGAFQNKAQQMCDLKQPRGSDNMELYV